MNAHGGDDIAIVGMSACFSDAPDMARYWYNIIHGHDAIHEAPEGWDLGPFNDGPDYRPHEIFTRKGGFVRGWLSFDPYRFSIPPIIVKENRPDAFMALELAYRALEDAGELSGKALSPRTGVILGHANMIDHYQVAGITGLHGIRSALALLKKIAPSLTPEMVARLEQGFLDNLSKPRVEKLAPSFPNVVSAMVAHHLDLNGPNYTVDAACASALVAMDQAVMELLTRRCDMMVVGALQMSVGSLVANQFCNLGAMTRGDIRPFDRNASGTLMGEGGAIFILKRLDDALRDGNRIYALVKGIGIASDGASNGLLAPSRDGELLAMRRAWERSGLDPQQVELVEAHGTGVALGDTTELDAMFEFWGERKGPSPHCAISAVKSMIGHCLDAAGAAGLANAVLALHHRILPPTLCDEVREHPALTHGPFYINTTSRPWIHPLGGRRVAAVTALGFGGINSHAILEEWPGVKDDDVKHHPFFTLQTAPPLLADRPLELCLFSGNGPGQLMQRMASFKAEMEESASLRLAEMAARTWEGGHEDENCRLALVVQSREQLLETLDHLLAGGEKGLADAPLRGVHYRPAPVDGKLALLFPGEGSQRPNPLGDLFLYHPQIRDWFDAMETLCDGHGASLSRLLFPPPDALSPGGSDESTDPMYSMKGGVMSVWPVSYALHEMLAAHNISASGVVGHSAGEMVALLVSGMVGPPDRPLILSTSAYSMKVFSEFEQDDALEEAVGVAVGGVDREALDSYLALREGRLHLAMDNCPGQQVVFGSAGDIKELEVFVAEQGGLVFPMPFGRPYHTPLFQAGADRCRQSMSHVAFSRPEQTIYSCMTAAPLPEEREELINICSRQWSERVRFRETVLRMYDDGYRIFLEAGPGALLTSFVRDTLKGRDFQALSCDTLSGGGLRHWLSTLGSLFVCGIDLDAGPMFHGRLDPGQEGKEYVFELPRHDLDLSPDMIDELRQAMEGETVQQEKDRVTQPAMPPGMDQVMERHFRFMEDCLARQEQAMTLLAEALARSGRDE